MARNISSFAIVMLLAAVAWAADDPPAPEADQPTADEAVAEPTLADLIEQIDAAEIVEDAVAAYNAANLIERGHVGANLAYMKKMLTFGQIQYAAYGARWIIATEADNTLALSVLGYCEAAAGDMEAALPAIIRALDQLSDDESLLADAGQLLAWLDVQEDMKPLPADVKRILAASRDGWEQQASFSEAYDDAAAVLQQFDEEIAVVGDAVEDLREEGLAIEDEIEILADRIEPIELEIYSLIAELDAVEDELAGTRRRAARLRRQVRATNARISQLEKVNPRTGAQDSELARRRADVARYERALRASNRRSDRYQLRERADELRDMIRANQREADELAIAIRRLVRDRKDVKDDFRRGKADLAALNADRRKMIRSAGRLLEWRLPAIDGEVIDVAEVSREYADRTRSSGRAMSDEANAAGKLQLAKKYIEIDKPEMAIKYLQLLLDRFGDSESATEAAQLLDQLQTQAETEV